MKGRATTPDAKRAIVERILRAWLANPSLRLGELLVAAWGEGEAELFYAEDEDLAGVVERMAAPLPHDLTPSQIALAKMLAAYDAWTPSGEPEDAVVVDLGEALWRARLTTNAGVLTAASRDLVDRARKAGVL